MRVFLVIAIVGVLSTAALDVDTLVAVKADQEQYDDGMLEAELIETADHGDWKSDDRAPGLTKTAWTLPKGVEFEGFDVTEEPEHHDGVKVSDEFANQVVEITEDEGMRHAVAFQITDDSVKWALTKDKDHCDNQKCSYPSERVAKLNRIPTDWDEVAAAAMEIDSVIRDELLSLSQDSTKLGHTHQNTWGDDKWKHVADTSLNPFLKVGRLAMGCTGTLIGSKVVITAGHCVYSHQTKKLTTIDKCTFTPGQNGDGDAPYGVFPAQSFIVSRKHLEAPVYSEAHDWALIILKDSPGLGFHGLSRGALAATTLTLAGYPQTKNKQQWVSTCPTTAAADDNSVLHKCNTLPGNSGSSMLSRSLIGWNVRAIHSAGAANSNYARKINKELFDLVTFYKAIYD